MSYRDACRSWKRKTGNCLPSRTVLCVKSVGWRRFRWYFLHVTIRSHVRSVCPVPLRISAPLVGKPFRVQSGWFYLEYPLIINTITNYTCQRVLAAATCQSSVFWRIWFGLYLWIFRSTFKEATMNFKESKCYGLNRLQNYWYTMFFSFRRYLWLTIFYFTTIIQFAFQDCSKLVFFFNPKYLFLFIWMFVCWMISIFRIAFSAQFL